MSNPAEIAKFTPDITSRKGEGLTRAVARFVVEAGYDAIPVTVTELGKKSILDGLGLALSGSAAESGKIVQKYLRGPWGQQRHCHRNRHGDKSTRPFCGFRQRHRHARR